jgi:hypothetical protein
VIRPDLDPFFEGTVKKGGVNREYQIQQRPVDPPPMCPPRPAYTPAVPALPPPREVPEGHVPPRVQAAPEISRGPSLQPRKTYDPASPEARAGDAAEQEFLALLQKIDPDIVSTKLRPDWTPALDRKLGDYEHSQTGRHADHKLSRSRPGSYAAPLGDWQDASKDGKLLIFRSEEHPEGIMFDPTTALERIEPTSRGLLFSFDFWRHRSAARALGPEAIASVLRREVP